LSSQKLAGERFRLGIGPSHRPTMQDMFGLPMSKPLEHLRAYLTVLHSLLWRAWRILTVHIFGCTRGSGVTPPRTPLLISALRPGTFRLAVSLPTEQSRRGR
jgi:alkanesulfonate monooxygenase SsuD/methylene tetrahydromethanopterin reductase-like flavin-dependent oxidoreductase (luciferase family)